MKLAREEMSGLSSLRLTVNGAKATPKAHYGQAIFFLTAYHFCGAVSHLKILRRGGGRCSRTKLAVSLSCVLISRQ